MSRVPHFSTAILKAVLYHLKKHSGLKVTGAILSDQVKSLDWKMRNTEFCDKIPETVIVEIFKKLTTLLRFELVLP